MILKTRPVTCKCHIYNASFPGPKKRASHLAVFGLYLNLMNNIISLEIEKLLEILQLTTSTNDITFFTSLEIGRLGQDQNTIAVRQVAIQ